MRALPVTFNAATYCIDRNVAEGRGAKVAIECGNERITYEQLLDRTNRVGNALKDLGVSREERVLLLLLDSPEFLYCFFGAIKIGAVPVPVSTLAKPQEWEYILTDSEAAVAVVSESLAEQFNLIPQNNWKHLREVIVAGEGQSARMRLQTLMEGASSNLDPVPTNQSDPAFWLYSSGSTGVPKGCVHLQRDMAVCSELYAKQFLRMTERDRCLSVARLFFAYGLGNAGYFPLACGATSILTPARPVPATIFADIERHKPTLFFSVPSNFAALLAFRREGSQDFDLSSIRHSISAGEALPAPLFQKFKERFGIEILDSLGSTETLHVVIANRPGEAQPGSSGKLIPGYRAKIVNEAGIEVPLNEIGDLWVQGDSICDGYWRQPEKTQVAFADQWFRTGDKYYQDSNACFWNCGRADDMFKVNGRWLSPVEVESALVSHPSVREAAVVARIDEAGLPKPAAYVVIDPAAVVSQDQLAIVLQEWVAERIGSYKRPRWIEFLPEIPKTATGKLQRFKLREREAGR